VCEALHTRQKNQATLIGKARGRALFRRECRTAQLPHDSKVAANQPLVSSRRSGLSRTILCRRHGDRRHRGFSHLAREAVKNQRPRRHRSPGRRLGAEPERSPQIRGRWRRSKGSSRQRRHRNSRGRRGLAASPTKNEISLSSRPRSFDHFWGSINASDACSATPAKSPSPQPTSRTFRPRVSPGGSGSADVVAARWAPSTCQVGLAGCRRLAVGIGLIANPCIRFPPRSGILGPGTLCSAAVT
jgi:hypothetical protein